LGWPDGFDNRAQSHLRWQATRVSRSCARGRSNVGAAAPHGPRPYDRTPPWRRRGEGNRCNRTAGINKCNWRPVVRNASGLTDGRSTSLHRDTSTKGDTRGGFGNSWFRRASWRLSRRSVATLGAGVILAHAALVHAQSPSATPPEGEPSANKGQRYRRSKWSRRKRMRLGLLPRPPRRPPPLRVMCQSHLLQHPRGQARLRCTWPRPAAANIPSTRCEPVSARWRRHPFRCRARSLEAILEPDTGHHFEILFGDCRHHCVRPQSMQNDRHGTLEHDERLRITGVETGA
jgi:hypothetical protein